MKRIELNGEWEGSGTDEYGKERINFLGTVPGCVHTDLMGEKMEQLYWRDEAEKSRWIERWNWSYSKRFSVRETGEPARLCFEGLDVYCDVYLNGHHLGYCADMFVPHEFAVDGILREGENELEVRFYSPVLRTEGMRRGKASFTAERLNTRRIQCTYGWDWVARFVTCGIWRPVYLEIGKEMRAETVYIYTGPVDKYSAQITAEIEFRDFERGGTVLCEILDPDKEVVWKTEFYQQESVRKLTADVTKPRLWYPAGYGEQPLYTLRVTVNRAQTMEEEFGIRQVKILELRDEEGSEYERKCLELKRDNAGAERYDQNEEFSGFIPMVNGIKVFCQGANWVPCEPFPSAERKEKITGLLELAAEAGVNMLRVWGGGIFEQRHFYRECDRLGILVTQDFLMACGEYPEEEEWFMEALRKEAAYAAKSLRNHPSLVWWTGDNENAVNGSDTDKDYRGRKSAYRAIAPELQKWDSQRRFLPSSPYGGRKYASKTVGTTHNTQFLSYLFAYLEGEDLSDYKEYYKQYLARFIAEEPSMGAAGLPSLKKMMTEEDIYGASLDMWRYHTRSNPELKRELVEYTMLFAEKVLGRFRDGADRYFKLKYIQYEWIRIGMELYRRNQWFCSGVLYWMLADCWPAASGWSVIDYYGVPKAGYYSLKRCTKPQIVSIDREGETLRIMASNLSVEDVRAELEVLALKGGETEQICQKQVVLHGDKAETMLELRAPERGKAVVCRMKLEKGEDRAFYREGDLKISPSGGLEVVGRGETSITLRAERYIHVVELEGSAVFEDSYFSMLPGEERRIGYRAVEPESEITVRSYSLEA